MDEGQNRVDEQSPADRILLVDDRLGLAAVPKKAARDEYQQASAE
jgi:hypothetical protein